MTDKSACAKLQQQIALIQGKLGSGESAQKFKREVEKIIQNYGNEKS